LNSTSRKELIVLLLWIISTMIRAEASFDVNLQSNSLRRLYLGDARRGSCNRFSVRRAEHIYGQDANHVCFLNQMLIAFKRWPTTLADFASHNLS